jgi:hypothetical protein
MRLTLLPAGARPQAIKSLLINLLAFEGRKYTMLLMSLDQLARILEKARKTDGERTRLRQCFPSKGIKNKKPFRFPIECLLNKHIPR